MKSPSVYPVAAASRQLSVSIAASPVKDDIGLTSGRLVSLREIRLRPVPRWIAAWLGPHPPPLRCCALASTLSTERHSCRSGHTARESVVPYSAWHTPIACVGVVVLYRRGCWPFPACPRTYLRPSSIKAGPLPSSALSCTPSQVLRAPRTPSRLRSTSAIRLYTSGLCPTRLPVRASPVPRSSLWKRATAYTPERSSRRSDPGCCLLPSP